MKRVILFVLLSVLTAGTGFAQMGVRITDSDEFSYLNPQSYIIGGVRVTGVEYLDPATLVTISGLVVGSRIEVPSEATSDVIKNMMRQDLFDEAVLYAEAIRNDSIFFEIRVVERPRLTRIDINGLSKTQTTEVRERLDKNTGKIVNENLINTTRNTIRRYLAEKNYLYPDIKITPVRDTTQLNNQILVVDVDRNHRVRVERINFTGNSDFSDRQLRKFFKGVRQKAWFRIFGPGKFKEDKFKEAKENLIAKMHNRGYRDAEILRDSVYRLDEKNVAIDIDLHEGSQYYFGNITWQGNAKYSDTVLSRILGIEKGDVFSEEKLMTKLYAARNNDDISSLYMNDGHLAFSIDPVQSRIYGDTIDLELRLYEGAQFTINNVLIKGNDVTNDRVLLRSIHTKPGQKFSRENIVRSTRQIAQLGNFDEQATNPEPINVNHADGTVDIQYTVVEKPSDQVELSAGFGAGQVIGTVGLSFNNFSTHNFFKKDSWKPLPRGDGQKLSLRGQTSGKQYQSYSFSFSEPWLGGKKPIYFGVSAYTSHSAPQLNPYYRRYYPVDEDQIQRIWMNGVTLTLGKQLQWPDNWFQLNYSLGFQQYKLQNYGNYFLFDNGTSYNINLTQELSRNSVDAPIYPTSGSHIKLTIQVTPPYSLFNKINYPTAPDNERYKWTEYHKWKFDSQWFIPIVGKLVLKTQAQFGFLGSYSSVTGTSAFERFKLGGDGMMGFDFLQGSEIIAMRGYESGMVIPEGTTDVAVAQNSGSPIYAKYQIELRHPIILNDQATVFGLAFAEGGNTWNRFRDFNPFKVRRSIGVGARIFLPIFGMLGIDYGHAFDPIAMPPNVNMPWRKTFTFSIMQQMGGF